MNPDSVKVRIHKNVALIHKLLYRVVENVEMIENETNPDYGHIGDLAHIREGLFNILGEEDQAPSQG